MMLACDRAFLIGVRRIVSLFFSRTCWMQCTKRNVTYSSSPIPTYSLLLRVLDRCRVPWWPFMRLFSGVRVFITLFVIFGISCASLILFELNTTYLWATVNVCCAFLASSVKFRHWCDWTIVWWTYGWMISLVVLVISWQVWGWQD